MHIECNSLVNMPEIMKEYAKPSTDTIIEIPVFLESRMEKKEECMIMKKSINGYKVILEFPRTSMKNERVEMEIKEIMLQELKSKIKEMGK